MAAEIEGRIKVTAETGAAQDAIGKLADESRGLAKATDTASASTKSLAKETSDATVKVQAAREAIERAKRAQAEAAAVTQAFGRESREAAEAQTRLKNAEEAAAAAARTAEQAVAGAKQAVAGAAEAADNKAAPALKRMSAALERASKDAEKAASDLRIMEARSVSAAEAAKTGAERVTGALRTQIGTARAAQEAAAAASDRAVRALREHEAAVKKFGKGSDEAARALRRFEEAEKEARTEAVRADRAVKDASRAIDQLGREGNASAGDMQQLSKELLAVAQAADRAAPQLQAVNRVATAHAASTSKTSKAYKELKEGLKTTQIALGTFLGNMGTRAFDGMRDGIVGSAKAAIDFEDAMADVRKVLPDDTTAKQMAALGGEMKGLATSIGVMPQDVAKLTAELAQAGIAGDELVEVAGDAARLKVAFDMSAEKSGEALAKLRTSLGLSREEVNHLTGSINELSNKFAASAPEIVEAELRVASIAKTANVSAESAAALATAMIASGANADMAATGVKNFISALASGQAATKAQIDAFTALGLDAVSVAKEMAKGGGAADAAITDVVKRLTQLGTQAREQVLPVMIELFGKETLGTIGPLAANVELLGDAIKVAGDKTAAANSVQKEYEARSQTTAFAIDKMQAGIGVLAVQVGDALLPVIREVADFLASPEGQEWGRQAAADAADAIKALAEFVKDAVEMFRHFAKELGGTTTLVVGMGVAVAGLLGPFGLAMTAGVAMGGAIAEGVDRVLHRTERAHQALMKLHNEARRLDLLGMEEEREQQIAVSNAMSAQLDQDRRAQAAVDAWEKRERELKKIKQGSDEDLALTRRKYRMKDELLSGQYSSGTTFDERLKSFEDSFASEMNVPGLVDHKGKKKAERAAKKQRRLDLAQHEFDSSVADFEFATVQEMHARDAKQREFDVSVTDHTSKVTRDVQIAAFEEEQRIREQRIASMGEEIKYLDGIAQRERTQVDMILFTVDVEGEAARARDRLIDEQIEREIDLAKWEEKNAKTKEQRERAQTRLLEAEGKKRALAVQREVEAEEKQQRRREQIVGTVTSAITTLGEGMVSAFEAMAKGEKGAIAEMLSELLKGVAKKHAILALGEAALAVGAAASYRYAAAAQHGTAAALHTGVAIAAGTGAYAAGQIADARRGGGGGEDGPAAFGRGPGAGGSGAGGGAPSGGGGGGGDDEGLEAQEVPISHEQLRRHDDPASPATSRRGGAPIVVNISGVTLNGGASQEEFGNYLRKLIDRTDRGGRRPRN